MSMDTHVKLLGWLYIILGALGLLAALVVVTAVFGGGLISQDQTAIAVTGLVAAIVGGLIVVFSVPGIVAGIGLIQYRQWARIFTLVLGFLNLPNFPVGTVVGIYTLVALLSPEAERAFGRPTA